MPQDVEMDDCEAVFGGMTNADIAIRIGTRRDFVARIRTVYSDVYRSEQLAPLSPGIKRIVIKAWDQLREDVMEEKVPMRNAYNSIRLILQDHAKSAKVAVAGRKASRAAKSKAKASVSKNGGLGIIRLDNSLDSLNHIDQAATWLMQTYPEVSEQMPEAVGTVAAICVEWANFLKLR